MRPTEVTRALEALIPTRRPRSARRLWAFARAWLRREIERSADSS